MNAFVESLAVQWFAALVLGVAPELTTGGLRYSPSDAILRWRLHPSPIERCYDGCERPEAGAGEPEFQEAVYRHRDPYLSEAIDGRRLPEP